MAGSIEGEANPNLKFTGAALTSVTQHSEKEAIGSCAPGRKANASRWSLPSPDDRNPFLCEQVALGGLKHSIFLSPIRMCREKPIAGAQRQPD